MPFTLTMPKLSPTMERGTITAWRVQVGQLVKPGDLLFEVATDKATVEHQALDEGYLRKILVAEGEEVSVNAPLAIFTQSAQESIENYVPEGTAIPPPPQEAEAKPEVVVAPQPAPTGQMATPAFLPEPPLESYRFPFPEGPGEGRERASPLARKLARERGIDLSTIKGSGPGGRIVLRDLALGQTSFGSRQRPTQMPGSYEEISLSPMRKVIARRLQEAKTFIPHFYVMQEVIADALVATREQLKTMELKISVNDLILRAAALALRQHPEINSGFHSAHETIVRFQTIDLAVAVSIPAGLITPIIRHADYKNLGQISSEVRQLVERARLGKLAREEYMGGSFTVSNLGMYGISEFIAVLNPPQAAILAIGGIEERAMVKGGQVVVGKTLRLTLSADHRVIDGADAAKFLKTLQGLLENPAILLI